MTDTYLLRLTGQQRDWLLAELHGYPDDSGTALTLYGRLLDCEPREAGTAPSIFDTEPAVKLPTMVPDPRGNIDPTKLLPPVDPRWLPDTPAEARAKADRKQILERAEHLIAVARAETYGSARESFARIGELWSTLLGTKVTATDVARMMIAMKLSRLTRDPSHADSWIDIAGYAALGAEIAGVEL